MAELLPKRIITEIEKLSIYIADNLNYELWDDAAFRLILSLKQKANRKYGLAIAGIKMKADVHAHITNSMRNERYCVVRRETV